MKTINISNNDLGSFFDKILDIMHDGIYITDSDGYTLKVNKVYETITGLKQKDLIGKKVTDLEKEGVFESPLNPLVVKTGKSHTFVQLNKMGKKVVISGNPVFDKSGNVVFVVTFVRDVTSLMQLKDEVADQRELIQKYFEETQYLRLRNFEKNEMIVKSSRMLELMELLKRVAKTDANVLILGETGVGKGVFALKLHEYSARREEPFFKVNCATIPDNLIESELFGYEPGAFTGANAKGKPGYFEMANKGTLFLDEIGELPITLQAKLLGVIQDQEVMRIGGNTVKKVDVRIIAATNVNLEKAVLEGKFRSDLYYRLRVATLEIPSLRERLEEIEPLIEFFLNKYNTKYKRKMSVSKEFARLLRAYHWPGNIREMENLIQGLIVTVEKEILDVCDLPPYILESVKKDMIAEVKQNCSKKTLKEIMDDYEKEVLKDALNKFQNVTAVAENLCVDRSTIFRKFKKYNII
jgi:PAS domain S-box-containing protein